MLINHVFLLKNYYYIQARTARLPSQFRFLNSGSPFNIGSDSDQKEYQDLMSYMEQSPGGGK